MSELTDNLLASALVGMAIPTLFVARTIAVATKSAHGTYFKLDKAVISDALHATKRRLYLLVGSVSMCVFFFCSELNAFLDR